METGARLVGTGLATRGGRARLRRVAPGPDHRRWPAGVSVFYGGRPVTVLRLRRQWLRHSADVRPGSRPYRGSPWKLTLTRPCPLRRARTLGSSAIFAPTTSAGPSALSCWALSCGRASSASVRSRFGPEYVAPPEPAPGRYGLAEPARERGRSRMAAMPAQASVGSGRIRPLHGGLAGRAWFALASTGARCPGRARRRARIPRG